MYGGAKHSRGPQRPAVDGAWVHRELRRAGVTLELLHMEYLEQHPDGYRYGVLRPVPALAGQAGRDAYVSV